ncbi:AAA family ATPase [Vibrio sp. V31_P5A7T61]|uniref:ParA family protein n=1 Tax=unclassified Vibrio TaxID=2614977 RepID=UPI001372FE9E|nr:MULTISPECIES: AAA family ATPase [unclassified Vibrio]NAW63113.1 AAA family ATPase [Vibrio sp. V31_P5A7T61]NAX02653.1 AAA family ATPase [Vibrio sp. V34_P3A8T189]NAX64624.1 AAA family ATPase [Vibrio sp. V32_P6A28T40]
MKVVSLINMKGGVAKTTVAVNLADCLARRHDKRVLLIDVDPQFNATQCLMAPDQYVEHVTSSKDTIVNIFDRNHRATASTVGASQVTQAKSLDEIEVVATSHFDLLPGSLELYRLEMAPGEGRENRLKAFLATISDRYDYVVIDTPPTPSVWMTSALIASQYYLIPVKADPISLTGIDLLKSIINEKKENFALQLDCAGLVLTLAEENTVVYKRAVANLQKDAFWSKYLYRYNIPKRTAIANKQLDQEHILDSDDASSKQRLAAIVSEFLNRTEHD